MWLWQLYESQIFPLVQLFYKLRFTYALLGDILASELELLDMIKHPVSEPNLFIN